MTTPIPTLTLNNGVEMPALGFGVFRTPPDATSGRSRRRSGSATGSSTQPPPTGMSARSARASAAPGSTAARSSSRRRSGSATTATTRHSTRSTRARQARSRADRPAPAAPAAAERVRHRPRGLPGAGNAAGRREGPRDRRQQLHARPPRNSCGRSEGRPGVNQIEVHPYFTQPETRGLNASKRSSLRRGRRSAGSPPTATGAEAHIRRPGHPDIAEAHSKTAAQVMLRWHLQEGGRRSRSRRARAHRGELRHVRLRAQRRRTRGDRRA